jgi:hypothetical protein
MQFFFDTEVDIQISSFCSIKDIIEVIKSKRDIYIIYKLYNIYNICKVSELYVCKWKAESGHQKIFKLNITTYS